MVNKNSKVVVSLRDLEPTLQCKGKYTSAKIKVLNQGQKDEKVLILEPSKETLRPVFKKATRSTTLGWAFLEMGLNMNKFGKSERPPKPRNNASYAEFNRYKNWNTISNEQKIKPHLENYAHDIGAELVSFEILE